MKTFFAIMLYTIKQPFSSKLRMMGRNNNMNLLTPLPDRNILSASLVSFFHIFRALELNSMINSFHVVSKHFVHCMHNNKISKPKLFCSTNKAANNNPCFHYGGGSKAALLFKKVYSKSKAENDSNKTPKLCEKTAILVVTDSGKPVQ